VKFIKKMKKIFKGFLVSQNDKAFETAVTDLSTDRLPKGEVLIRVLYSSLNYKDALSASGNKGISRRFPHVPGIDAAGVVEACSDGSFRTGQEVLVTGFDLGMGTWGGFGEYIIVPSSWVLDLPKGLSLEESMYFGTAGLTAGLSLYALLQSGIKPPDGQVAVSGVSGGVGSLATAMLTRLGYEVCAISGRKDSNYLSNTLGLSTIMAREEFTKQYDEKPMAGPDFIGGIDTVGGRILSGMMKATRYGGMVTCCGNVSSPAIETSIFPFILRGIHLVGIDSVQAGIDLRKNVWGLLAKEWKPVGLKAMVQVITLDEVAEKLDLMLKGRAEGRYVLKHSSTL
jgi:putative YhdH/YhfP family quinone oxidoreductase